MGGIEDEEREPAADAVSARPRFGAALKLAAAAALLSLVAAVLLPPVASTGLRLAFSGDGAPDIDPVIVGSTRGAAPVRYTVRHSVLGADGRDCVVIVEGERARAC